MALASQIVLCKWWWGLDFSIKWSLTSDVDIVQQHQNAVWQYCLSKLYRLDVTVRVSLMRSDKSIVSIFIDYLTALVVICVDVMYFFPISIIIQGIPYYAYKLPLFGLEIYGLSYSTHQLVWPPWCCVLGWSYLGCEYKDPQAALLSVSKTWVLSRRHLGEWALPPFFMVVCEGISGLIYHVPFLYNLYLLLLILFP